MPAFVDKVKREKGTVWGFGHRVYKNYDPRATIIKRTAYDVFEVTGKNPLIDIALALEEVALSDELLHRPAPLPERRLLLGPHLPGDGLPARDVHGAIRDPEDRRVAGALRRPLDQDMKIARPRQLYVGKDTRDYVEIAKREG